MANDEARNRGVYSFLTREARLGNGPMIAVPVESTREAILMDAAEPIQGAIDEYLDDLADRALFQDAVLAAMELNECGKYQDFLKVGQLMSLEREDSRSGDGASTQSSRETGTARMTSSSTASTVGRGTRRRDCR